MTFCLFFPFLYSMCFVKWMTYGNVSSPFSAQQTTLFQSQLSIWPKCAVDLYIRRKSFVNLSKVPFWGVSPESLLFFVYLALLTSRKFFLSISVPLRLSPLGLPGFATKLIKFFQTMTVNMVVVVMSASLLWFEIQLKIQNFVGEKRRILSMPRRTQRVIQITIWIMETGKTMPPLSLHLHTAQPRLICFNWL